MYRFQINAPTQVGESIGLIGSTPELGEWDVTKYVPLQTSPDRYPLWWADLHIDRLHGTSAISDPENKLEYKYIRLNADGSVEWEGWGWNRWVPIETDLPATVTIDDGQFGRIQPWPYGYFQTPVAKMPLPQGAQGLKIAVLGSSVALGCSAWLLRGWAWHLEQTLHQQGGHQLVNLSELGASVSTTIARFQQVVAPQQPDIVIISLSLGNEGLAYCPPHQRRAVQRRFESGLQQLVKMTQDLGARPMLGGVYPHGDYTPEQAWLLQDTHDRMLSWGVPVFDWLAALGDGNGRWKVGAELDLAHPNTEGHRLMYEAIDLNLFAIDKAQFTREKQHPRPIDEVSIYRNNRGLQVFSYPAQKRLRAVNASQQAYTIAPDWEELQAAIQSKAALLPGIYIAQNPPLGTHPSFAVRSDGSIETPVLIPPATELDYCSAFDLFAPNVSDVLFYDGQLALLKESDRALRMINEADCEYNVHPMWKEVRSALKAMPPGVYEDRLHPDVPFRTTIVGKDGLESRVKVPAKSSILFEYQCSLSERSRIALIPLGDRCAMRMMLYKMEYDGPAFPFDLTRTTNLGDIADIIATGFEDMWNPALLDYNAIEKRIYHRKWSGLSFAHEVEDTEDPVNDMSPVYGRMYVRYKARSDRFWYTIEHCDRLLFLRTGGTNRDSVLDLVDKLEAKCHGKPFNVLLASPQPSEEFTDIPHVLHYNLFFDPDRMYADVGHWLDCTKAMQTILESLGVSSKNLFWCPPNLG